MVQVLLCFCVEFQLRRRRESGGRRRVKVEEEGGRVWRASGGRRERERRRREETNFPLHSFGRDEVEEEGRRSAGGGGERGGGGRWEVGDGEVEGVGRSKFGEESRVVLLREVRRNREESVRGELEEFRE